jgi:sugar/nucleoside kinase (ribokinase family)
MFDASIFGLIVADLIATPLRLRQPPAPGGLALVDSITLTTGGNVCNTGVAMAKLGAKVAVCGLVGDDVLGRTMVDQLGAAGLDTAGVRTDPREQTSATVVAVEPGGERVFFHTAGVTKLLDAAAFRAGFETFARSAWLQIGYFGLLPTLTPRLPALLAELRQFAPDLKIALDTVNPPADARLLEPILPHLDLFAPSRTEAAALTGESDPVAMARHFRARMPAGAIVGIKLDAEGCYVADAAGDAFVPAYRIDCVDTTGAGDTWFGALLLGLTRGMPLPQAARFANRAAADCCSAIGASTGVRGYADTLARAV